MAERKSGPVKPPVIDLKARDASVAAETAKPAVAVPVADPVEVTEAADKPAEPQRPAQPRPQARLAMPWSAISIAALGGAVLGTVLTYGLVNLLPLPDNRLAIADPSARLDNQDASLADIETRLTAVEEQTKRTQISLDATLAQLDAGLSELKGAIAALPGPGAPVDIAPLEAQLQSLEDRVAAIGAGASSADASALATTIARLEAGLSELKTQLTAQLTAQEQRFAAQDGAIANAESDIAVAKTAIATQNQTLGGTEIGPAVRLPLVVAGIESAFGNGRPFAAELANLTALLPDLAVPEAIAAAAPTGLPRPDSVAARFSDAVPTILSGRTGTSSGDLGQDALDWMKALLALRPTGELEGTTPEAIVSQLEAAVERRDFVAAAKSLDSLPAPMQAVAGNIGSDIRTLAAAENFITGLRSTALATTEPAT